MTPAHDQQQTIHGVVHYPEHTARIADKYQSEFDAAKTRLKALGLYKCVVCGVGEGEPGWDGQPASIELHHSHVEFSMENTIDLVKANEAFGQHFASDDDFAKWVDSPDNLEPLCVYHHRGAEGIHVVPGTLWDILRLVKVTLHNFISYKGNI